LLDAVVVGGTALSLLGLTTRATRDVDVMYPDIPAPIAEAAAAFAQTQRSCGNHLADDWFNNGPSQLQDVLPEGWQKRLQPAFLSVPSRCRRWSVATFAKPRSLLSATAALTLSTALH